jgi:hypothetical protein
MTGRYENRLPSGSPSTNFPKFGFGGPSDEQTDVPMQYREQGLLALQRLASLLWHHFSGITSLASTARPAVVTKPATSLVVIAGPTGVSRSDLRPRPGLSGRRRVECFLQSSFGSNTHETLNGLAPFEEQQGGDTGDTKALCNAWVIVNIHFADTDSRILAGQFIDHGSDLTAGSAPGCPKINEDCPIGLQHISVKIVISEFFYGIRSHRLLSFVYW